ncbi:COR domain-containing protein, partial [Flectobacillus roseus]|uniref:COR domain-containing protein n=1 Tax=Flectobacillus roseus TaxID=502259 RepID=UPI0024B651FC
KLTNLNSLDLRNNKITDIRFLEKLTNLNSLDLRNNKITDIRFLEKLTNLNSLDLRNNKITDFRFLEKLTNLNSLDLRSNQITDITPIVPLIQKGIAISLKEYDWEQNINLYNNPITTPPLHIIEQGSEAILAWFENKKVSELKPFREAKVILLGEPDAGKSNLLNYFIGRDFETEKSVTRGVKIEKYVFQHKGNDYQINFWDFGGQEVQQSVHQYFLTENTLYIIVLNAVTDEQPDKYLQFLNNHAPNSPFIIVTNKDDLQGTSKIKNNQLNADYEGRIIASNIRISLKQAAKKEWCPANTSIFEDRNRQLKELFDLVKSSFLKLPHIEEGFLENYRAVKNVIEDVYNNQKKPYITIQEFTEFCRAKGIVVGTEHGLLSLLNVIGTVRFLDEDNLRGLHILNPEWLSDGIYRIITDGDVKNKKLGKIQKKDILQILSPQPDSVYTYQVHEIDFLVDMMCSFRVAYFDREEKSIYIPDSFPEDLPNGFNKSAFIAQSKHYFFSYDTEIPSYIISRFIVKSFQYVKEKHYWNKGIVLEDKEYSLNPCEALIEQNDRKIDIWIKGKDIQSFFVRIREILRNTHEKTFKKYTEMINLGEESVPYEAIWNLKIDGDQTYKSQKIIDKTTGKLKIYNINEILGRFETKETMEQKGNITINTGGGDFINNGQFAGKKNTQTITNNADSSKTDEFKEIKEILQELQEANVNNELWKSTLVKCLDEFTKLEEAEDKSVQKGIIETSFSFLKMIKEGMDGIIPVAVIDNLPKLIDLWNKFKAKD